MGFFKNNFSHFSLFTKMSIGIKRTISSFYSPGEDFFQKFQWDFAIPRNMKFYAWCISWIPIWNSQSAWKLVYIVSSSKPWENNIWGWIQHIVVDITDFENQALFLILKSKPKWKHGIQHSRFSPPSTKLISNNFYVILICVWSDFWF